MIAVLEYLDILFYSLLSLADLLFIAVTKKSPNYSGIIPDCFSYLLFPKLFQHILLVPSRNEPIWMYRSTTGLEEAGITEQFLSDMFTNDESNQLICRESFLNIPDVPTYGILIELYNFACEHAADFKLKVNRILKALVDTMSPVCSVSTVKTRFFVEHPLGCFNYNCCQAPLEGVPLHPERSFCNTYQWCSNKVLGDTLHSLGVSVNSLAVLNNLSIQCLRYCIFIIRVILKTVIQAFKMLYI